MHTAVDILIGAALVIGLFFNTMGVLGILRFPDVYTRLHADTKATTFGSIFIGLAVVVWAIRAACAAAAAGAWVNLLLHVLVAVVVLLVTNATGGHAIARAAWLAGYRPRQAVVDALSADADAGTLDTPDEPVAEVEKLAEEPLSAVSEAEKPAEKASESEKTAETPVSEAPEAGKPAENPQMEAFVAEKPAEQAGETVPVASEVPEDSKTVDQLPEKAVEMAVEAEKPAVAVSAGAAGQAAAPVAAASSEAEGGPA